ncbi:Ni/Fe-hydrogenase cytochrome b subunit [bacterium]|nr:Ni/Fe-hydrogenase cytochrome b subunit [bacterium]
MPMAHHGNAAPVKAPLITTSFMIAAVLVIVTGALILWRFAAGLGPATAMTDVQPWGVWKLFNVIVLTAIGSGGYAVALLVYVLNRGHYHSLVRHALLTSAVGYTVAIFALGIDVGAPWNFWKVVLWSWHWNADSVLLEVAICISAYVPVLWAEMSPAFLERWKDRDDRLGRFSRWALPVVDKALIWIIGLGIVLPTMHQSSLGSLYLLAGTKVHPYWQTAWLPLFFLLSCWIMGYAAVITSYIVTTSRFCRRTDARMLQSLGKVASWVIFFFLAARLADLAYRGQLAGFLTDDYHNWYVLGEFALLLIPAIWLQIARKAPLSTLFRSGMMIVLGAVTYRMGAVWLGYHPMDGSTYFPSVPELIITIGFIAMQVLVYLLVIKNFPILSRCHEEGQPQAS